MASFRKDLLVLSGLTCDKGAGQRRGQAAATTRAWSAFLTGVPVSGRPRGSTSKPGISANRSPPSRLGEQTRLASLELGIEPDRGSGNWQRHGCVYEHTMW